LRGKGKERGGYQGKEIGKSGNSVAQGLGGTTLKKRGEKKKNGLENVRGGQLRGTKRHRRIVGGEVIADSRPPAPRRKARVIKDKRRARLGKRRDNPEKKGACQWGKRETVGRFPILSHILNSGGGKRWDALTARRLNLALQGCSSGPPWMAKERRVMEKNADYLKMEVALA